MTLGKTFSLPRHFSKIGPASGLTCIRWQLAVRGLVRWGEVVIGWKVVGKRFLTAPSVQETLPAPRSLTVRATTLFFRLTLKLHYRPWDVSIPKEGAPLLWKGE